MSEGVTRLQDCNVHVALMGSEFGEQGMYIHYVYALYCGI